MAFPEAPVAGTLTAATTGNLACNMPSHQAGDLLVVVTSAWHPNTAGTMNDIAAPVGWTGVQSSPNVRDPAAGNDGRAACFMKVAASAAETLTLIRPTGWDTGTDGAWTARVYRIRNVDASAPLFASTRSGSNMSAGADLQVPAASVAGAGRDCLVLAMLTRTDDYGTAPSTLGGVYTQGTATETTTGTDGAAFFAYRQDTADVAATNASIEAAAQGGHVWFVLTIQGPHPAMPAPIGGAFAATSSTTLQMTVTQDVPAGQRVLVVAGDDGSNAPLSSCVDSRGNAYVTDSTPLSLADNYRGRIMSAVLDTGLSTGDTITVTFAGRTGLWDTFLRAFATSAVGAVDQTANATGSGTAWDSGLTPTTTDPDALVFGLAVAGGNPSGSTPGTDLTEVDDSGATSAFIDWNVVARVVSATGQYRANGTWSTSDAWGASAVVYKLAGASLERVSATRALQWAIIQRSTATRTLQYAVAQRVSGTRTLQYALKERASATRSLLYAVKQRSSATRALQWGVVGRVSAARALQWTVRQRTSATRTLQYTILVGVAASRQLLWSLAQRSSATRTLLYSLAQRATSTRTLLYGIAGRASATRVLQWAVLQRMSATRALQWALRVRASATRILQYDVRARASATRALQWGIRAYVAATRELRWGIGGRVSATRTLLYQVRQRASATRTLLYSVFVSRSATRTLLYALRQKSSNSRVLNWFVQGRSMATRTLQYGIRERVGDDRELRYAVNQKASSTRELQYAIKQQVTAERELRYELRERSSATRELRWSTVQRVSAQRELQWEVVQIGRVSNTLRLEYALRERTAKTLTVQWLLRRDPYATGAIRGNARPGRYFGHPHSGRLRGNSTNAGLRAGTVKTYGGS